MCTKTLARHLNLDQHKAKHGGVNSGLVVVVAVTLLVASAVFAYVGILHKKSSSGHWAKLSWKPSTSVVKGYNIYRTTHPGGPYPPSTRINTIVHPGTTYVDTQVAPGITYYYVVTAVAASGVESRPSEEIRAVIPHDKH